MIGEYFNVPKWEFAFIINSSDNEQKSQTYSCNSQGGLQKPQYIKILIHMGYISENAIFMQFYVILPDILWFIQLALNVIRYRHNF